jgi:50S ribosomal protein L16 3-hydroxylase
MTFSVGMRAPSSAEMLIDFAEDLAQKLPEYQRYADPDLSVPDDPYEIDDQAFARVDAALAVWQQTDAVERRRWFGQFITRYRAAGDVQAGPNQAPWPRALQAMVSGQSLFRHPFARFAWCREGKHALLHVTGESHRMEPSEAAQLCRQTRLDMADFTGLGKAAQHAVEVLYAQGVYQLAESE